MDNIEHAVKDNRTELVRADIASSEQINKASQNIDGVFHLAALCLAHCQDNPREALNVNITGTFNLLEACVRNRVGRVVFASSSSVYGNAVYSPMDEEHPKGYRNFYGATKIIGEALLRAFYYKYGLDYVALRFMNVYGPRQDYLGAYIAVIMKIIDRLRQNLPPVIYGDGSQGYDFVFVKDTCQSCILAMQSSISDQVCNISSGKQTSILELCNLISRIMKKDIPPEFKQIDDDTLVTDRTGSTEKAKKYLGFEVETPLEEGLKEVIEWKLGLM